MRNSLLTKEFCTEDLSGLKFSTEDKDTIALQWYGRGASLLLRSSFARKGGAVGSENVGMSNRNPDESSGHRKPKVSLAMSISQGLGGPKTNPKGVVDGQPVNIPALLYFFTEMTENWILRVLLDLLLRASARREFGIRSR